MQKKTIVRRKQPEKIPDALLELSPILQHIYSSRGIKTKEELDRTLSTLPPYDTLKNIEPATERLVQALRNQEKVIIIGDFDVDGATSTTLAVTALRAFGLKNIHYLVPNRFEYGYGLTPAIVELAAKENPNLLITVDNGISSISGTEKATELGIDVLITDHHLPGDELPKVTAIVNPNQQGDKFPTKHLAGVGVIFYVMLALRAKLRAIDWFTEQGIHEANLAELLDLVALGTVADVVPLDQTNRILVYQGLQRIRSGYVRPGIKALLEIANRNIQHLSASDLGYAIAPRLNAAGRLTDMSVGIECLLSQTIEHARTLAIQLEQLNRERREIEVTMRQEAQEQMQNLIMDQANLPAGLCLFDENWHQGIVGIVASRIKDQYHRPTIAFAAVNDLELKGSARSIPGVHIRDALSLIAAQHPSLLTKFGGHAMAAGLTLPKENYGTFCTLFNQTLDKLIDKENLQGKIYSDGALDSTDFNLDIAYTLANGGPWGQHFPEPLFDDTFIILNQRIVGNHHLKLTLQIENTTQTLEAIAFYVDTQQWPNERIEKIHAAYRLDINRYRDIENIQLIIEELRAC